MSTRASTYLKAVSQAFLVVLLLGLVQSAAHAQMPQTGPWAVTENRTAHGGSVVVSGTPWSGASFTARGPRVVMWYVASERGGKAAVLLNGRRVATVDMYAKRTTKRAITLRGVAGQNVVQVVVLPERNAKSKGNRIAVDAFSQNAKTCSKGCAKTPTPLHTTTTELADSGTWYPSEVPATDSALWTVAISSYVRGRDASPADTAGPVIRSAACDTAKRVQRGVVVLSFGAPTATGTTGFGKPLTYQELSQTAQAWAAGLAECGNGPWEVALATSNSGAVTAFNGYAGGARWAQLIEETTAGADPRVVISGAVDLEPGWGPPGQARAWVDGYVASSARRLWNFGSADGCPQTYLTKLTCNNGWTIDDVIWVSSRAGANVVAMPQLHTQSGSLARQWAVLAERALATGEPLRIAAVGVQTAACAQTKNGCPTTGETAWDAWSKLRGYLDARDATRGMPLGAPRDIRWGWGDAFIVPPPTTTTSTTSTTTTTTTAPAATTTTSSPVPLR